MGFLAWAGWQVWFHTRPQPAPLRKTLFPGVEYVREIHRRPRPIVAHLVTVELSTPGLQFLVTPGDPGRKLPLDARTTSGFAREFRVQLAINGDFFYPWRSNSLIDYYPAVGDPVRTEGRAVSRGVDYSRPGAERFPTLFFTADNQVSFKRPRGQIYNAVSGMRMLVHGGVIPPLSREKDPTGHPRTAVGLDRPRRRLFLAVIDGRQPNYSDGVSQTELAGMMVRWGCYDALNLDGGGSSTLVMVGKLGEPEVLNCPIDNRIPGRERPVGNHLGIIVEPR